MPNFGSNYAIIFNVNDIDIKSFVSYISELMDSLFYRTDDTIEEYFADSKNITHNDFKINYNDYSDEYHSWAWENFPGRYDKQWDFDREFTPGNLHGIKKVIVQNLTTDEWEIRNVIFEQGSTFEKDILVTAYSYFDIIRSKEWLEKIWNMDFHIVINDNYFSFDKLTCIDDMNFDDNTFVVFIYSMNF